MQPEDRPLTALGIAPRGLFLRGLEDDEYSAYLPFRTMSHWSYSSDSLSFFLPTHPFQTCYSFEVQHCGDAVDLLLHYLKSWRGLRRNGLLSVISVWLVGWLMIGKWIGGNRSVGYPHCINEVGLKWIMCGWFVGWTSSVVFILYLNYISHEGCITRFLYMFITSLNHRLPSLPHSL